MIDSAVRLEFLANPPINAALVCTEMRFARSDGNDQRPKHLGGNIGNVERSSFAITLDEREDCLFLRRWLVGSVAGFAADIGFIGFDELAFAAERAGVSVLVHALANA